MVFSKKAHQLRFYGYLPYLIAFGFFTFCDVCLAQQAYRAHLDFHRSGISDRNLLRLQNWPIRLSKAHVRTAPVFDEPDTLSILAIRVEFQPDNNDLTTGDGRFDFSPSTETRLDPAPHNLAYFEHQLTALASYFKTVSRGRLILKAELFPKEPEGSFVVSEQMNFYAPTGSEDLLDRRLTELFAEGFAVADASEAIDFSEFDSFILFHAGVGSDFAFDFDPTPQDIPSVFLDFATLREHLGGNDPGFPGIGVNDGQFFIRDGIILPETQSQQDFEIALLGTMAIMFGHQLGLPNLFNTDTGRPGIGVFGLMDQGSGNFLGLLPAEPSAWSKVFLGWENPIEVRNGVALDLAAPHSFSPNKIYKIPIDSQEYFLVENRNRDVNRDGIALARDADGTRIEFRWDDEGQRIVADGPFGVITEVNEYDFGLPGSGLLIWHVDERVIAANFASNRVNADPQRRGVDLEEADGAQDIGQVYGFLDAGSGSENGVIEDMFWGSNPINKLVNDSSAVVAFTPHTTPGSVSNSGANSHIFITDFSEPDTVMRFTVREAISQTGFPQSVGVAGALSNPLAIADLNDDGTKEIIWSANSSTDVLVWNADGSKFIPNQDSVQVEQFDGKSRSYPLAIFAQPRGSLTFPVAVARLDGQTSVVVVVTDQVVAAYLPGDADENGRADSLFVYEGAEEFITPPLIIETNGGASTFRIVVGTAIGNVITVNAQGTGSVIANVSTRALVGFAVLPPNRMAFTTISSVGVLSLEGSSGWEHDLSSSISMAPVVGDLDLDGTFDVIFVTNTGELVAFDDAGAHLTGYPRQLSITEPSAVALGDVDGDRFLEIVLLGQGGLYAFNRVGALTNNFPISLNLAALSNNGQDRRSPILADLNDDGLPEIIAGTSANQLVALDSEGKLAQGFPLSTGSVVNSTPAVGDLDSDGDIELTAVSDDGFLYVWDLAAGYLPHNIPWGSFGHNAQNLNANLNVQSPPSPAGQLMPNGLVYNYPNPTKGDRTTIRYRLNFPAEVRISIYDLAGQLVGKIRGPGIGQVDNEVEWPLANVESGVYLARVEARTSAMNDVVVFKIAVVK